MEVKEFFRRWKQGFLTMSPARLLHSKMFGIKGNIVGIILGGTVMVQKGYWYFSIMFIFMIFLQSLELISTRQQYKQALSIQQSMEGIDDKEEK